MATLQTSKLRSFYENYGNKEIAFNKSIIKVTGLETKKIFVKIRGEQIPCVLYSCSMKTTRVIVNLSNSDFEEIKRAKNFVSLRLSFNPKLSKEPVVFFVPATVKGYNSFGAKNQSIFLMSLEFNQKPPDDLIEIMGKIFESIENFEKRKELRIDLSTKVIGALGLGSNKGISLIDNIKRPCIVRNISPSGCFIVMLCNPKFILQKDVQLFLVTKGGGQVGLLGKIVRSEPIEGRADMHGLGIQFVREKIPYEYKEMINIYIDELELIAKRNRNK